MFGISFQKYASSSFHISFQKLASPSSFASSSREISVRISFFIHVGISLLYLHLRSFQIHFFVRIWCQSLFVFDVCLLHFFLCFFCLSKLLQIFTSRSNSLHFFFSISSVRPFGFASNLQIFPSNLQIFKVHSSHFSFV